MDLEKKSKCLLMHVSSFMSVRNVTNVSNLKKVTAVYFVLTELSLVHLFNKAITTVVTQRKIRNVNEGQD